MLGLSVTARWKPVSLLARPRRGRFGDGLGRACDGISRHSRERDRAHLMPAERAAVITVENPATGGTLATVPAIDAEKVREVVGLARAAQPAWAATGFAGRARVMWAARRWLISNRRRMVQTIVAETGKPREDALNVEIVYVADALGFWARRARHYLREERVHAHSPFLIGKRLTLRRRPHGVVGVIGPWNYPLILCFGDAIPALMAGNAAVLKPSELTPLSTHLMAEGMREAGLPEHLMPVLTGAGETGAAVVDAVDMVQFTGSTASGKAVMARAAQTLTPVSLELGGKDPMIVLADADLDRAADAACWYGLCHAGQCCWSVERIYVEAPAYEPFLDRLRSRVRALRTGPADGPGIVDIGPLSSEAQLRIVDEHVQDARRRGAKVLSGGMRDRREGHFYEPTILVDVNHEMRAMREETFGPTLPVMKVADAEQAVALANDSAYGLNSSVWTADRKRGEQIARRLKAGNACVNDAVLSGLALELPFGATGDSGLGARHGAEGIRKYCTTQSLLVNRIALPELQRFPYRARRSRHLERLIVLLYGHTRWP